MADRAAARGPLLARRRVAVAAAYATVGLCQCGVACAAPLSLARPGQESASVHGSNGTPDGAKPVRPLLLLLLPVPERRMRMRLQTDGSGGNDDSREDMHGETQSSRRDGVGLQPATARETAAQARRLQLHGTAQRNPAPMLNYSTHDTVPVRGLYRTVHAHTDAWLSKDKGENATAYS